jgi:hypothetical protein
LTETAADRNSANSLPLNQGQNRQAAVHFFALPERDTGVRGDFQTIPPIGLTDLVDVPAGTSVGGVRDGLAVGQREDEVAGGTVRVMARTLE